MKIAIVYFEENLTGDRSHHQVSHQMLKGWQYFYERSQTAFEPCLILDDATQPPSFWKYGHVRASSPNPPSRIDVLNKVGWLKSQAYDLLGKCVVMDLDALLLDKIDELEDFSSEIAMSPDGGTIRDDWEWIKDWPEAKKKYNAGVLFLNSDRILPRFRELWDEKSEYLRITYFDEIIFSSMLTEMNGLILDTSFNTPWSGDIDYHGSRVLHFSGDRKSAMLPFLAKQVI